MKNYNLEIIQFRIVKGTILIIVTEDKNPLQSPPTSRL